MFQIKWAHFATHIHISLPIVQTISIDEFIPVDRLWGNCVLHMHDSLPYSKWLTCDGCWVCVRARASIDDLHARESVLCNTTVLRPFCALVRYNTYTLAPCTIPIDARVLRRSSTNAVQCFTYFHSTWEQPDFINSSFKTTSATCFASFCLYEIVIKRQTDDTLQISIEYFVIANSHSVVCWVDASPEINSKVLVWKRAYRCGLRSSQLKKKRSTQFLNTEKKFSHVLWLFYCERFGYE